MKTKIKYRKRTFILLSTRSDYIAVKTKDLRFYSIKKGTEIYTEKDYPSISWITITSEYNLAEIDQYNERARIIQKYMSALLIPRLLKHTKYGRNRDKLKRLIERN